MMKGISAIQSLLLAGLLLSVMGDICAQSLLLQRANKLYDQLAFEEAVSYYQAALKKKDDAQAWARLGDCYRLTSQFELAESSYAQAVASGLVEPKYELLYAQALMANQRYGQAVRWLESYSGKMPGDSRAENLLEQCLLSDSASQTGFPCVIANLPVNSSRSDFAPTFAGDALVFTSDRDSSLGINRSTLWTGAAFLNLYISYPAPNGKFRKPRKLAGDLNGPYHDGPAVLDSAGHELWFTRSNYENGALWNRAIRSTDGNIKLEIQYALRETESTQWLWDEEGEFPWNHDQYSTAHPALSRDGRIMVFASDRPGGEGGVDLWLSEKSAEGEWGIPVNLGPQINSEGNEMYPFLHPDGQLLFSSDGWTGLGGLDIFLSEPGVGRRRWTRPVNMGEPVNSPRDDFGVLIADDWQKGYLSSNRKGGKGRDDIYAIESRLPELQLTVYDARTRERLPDVRVSMNPLANSVSDPMQLQTGNDGELSTALRWGDRYNLEAYLEGYSPGLIPEVSAGSFTSPVQKLELFLEPEAAWTVIGQVIDMDTREPLPASEVNVMIDGQGPARLRVDTEGFFSLELDRDRRYSFSAGLEGYFGDTEEVNTEGVSEPEEYYRVLELSRMKDQVVIELNNIYYDLNQAYIRRDGAPDLDNLAQLLRRFPQMAIEISAHTDSRADQEYNLDLSQRRADAAVAYLLELGIAPDRMIARGYGEAEIRNRCVEGVNCSEAEHQYNRRSEFRVLNFGAGITSTDKDQIPVNTGAAVNANYLRDLLSGQLDSLRDDEPLVLPDWENVPAADPSPSAVSEPDELPSAFGAGYVYGVELGRGGASDADRYAAYADLGTIQLESAGNGRYRFVIGFYDERLPADRVLAKLRERGLQGAYVVVYKDGKRLN